VLGLATSKRLISADTIAEGFGSAQGTPLLCSTIIFCTLEKTPWGATPKFSGGPSASELAVANAAKIAQDKAVADAKAAAEAAAKIAQDKAVADAKAAAEAAAKIAQDKAVADAKAAAEAAAKIAQDKAVADAKVAAEVAAKIAQDKAVADAKVAAEVAAKIAQDKANADSRLVAEQLARLQGDYSTLSENFSSNLSKYTEAMAQVNFLQNVLKTLQIQVEELLKPKPETIVCTKGSAYKIVKSIAPKCPVGYKKK
jgi:hypothetical protein